MIEEAGQSAHLSWGLCVATLDRIDMLEVSVGLALAQTRPPLEIIVVDASADWETNAARIKALTAAHPAVRLEYLPAPKRSLTAQRNAGLDRTRADILFLLDDDSLMYPDCSAEIMKVYEADVTHRIAAVGARSMPMSPLDDDLSHVERLWMSRRARAWARLSKFARGESLLGRAFDAITMSSIDRRLVPYDRPGRHPSRADFEKLAMPDVVWTRLIFGYAITVRREVALRERFDDWLLAYCPGEDLDATYRFSRHGLNVYSLKGRVHHYRAAGGRMTSTIPLTLQMTNLAYFIQRNAERPSELRGRYYLFVARVALARGVKEIVNRRFALPITRATLAALPISRRIFARERAGLEAWYEEVQRGILSSSPSGTKPAVSPR